MLPKVSNCGLTGSALALLLAMQPAPAGEFSFTVTANSSVNYTIDGFDDPPLTLMRGSMYSFNLFVPNHPFFIKTLPGNGSGNAYNNGVSGNGDQGGVLTFAVPMDAPNQLFYNCGSHNAMGNSITIINGPFTFDDGFEDP